MAGGVRWRAEFDDQRVIVGYRIDVFDSDIATKAITAITVANPGVVTSTAHGFSNGDKVFIFNVLGMTEVNFSIQTVANKAANTFEIEDTSGFTAYVSGGTANLTTEVDQGGNPLDIELSGQDSDKYGLGGVSGSIHKSLAMFTFKQTVIGQFDDIINAEDDQFEVFIYMDRSNTHNSNLFTATNNLEFSGNLIIENISEPYNMIEPLPISFNAKNGLERLKEFDFEDAGVKIRGRQSVLTTLLFCLNLLDIKDNPEGNKIGLQEAVNIFEAGMDDAIDLSPLEQADIDPEIFRTKDDKPINCEEVVYALSLGFQFRLYMALGKWNVERVNQLNGTMERRLFDSNSELLSSESAYDPVVVTGTLAKLTNTRRMTNKSIKSVTAVFNAGQVVNIVPDGEFEAGAFATPTSFASGSWTISGAATIEKTQVSQPGSEFAVMITSLASGVGDFIKSPTWKVAQANRLEIGFKTRVDVVENVAQPKAPQFFWLLSWLQAGGTQHFLRDNQVTVITNITQANPGRVTTIRPHNLATSEKITMFGVLGMTEVNNTVFQIGNITATEFDLTGIDTTAFGAYISSGRVSEWVWKTSTEKNFVDQSQLNAWTDHTLGPFLLPEPGEAADMNLELYELDPNDYTPEPGTGILYDRVIGTISPKEALPVEVQEVTAVITASGSKSKLPDFELKFGDVAGFANQDFVLPVGSKIEIRIVFASTVAGDTLQFDINGVAKTFTTAIGKSINAISKANPAVVTFSVAHGFTNGQVIFIWDATGMTEINGDAQLGKTYTIANVAALTLELVGIDSTNFGTYTGSGKALLLSSDTFEDGPSLRIAIKNHATTGYKVGTILESGGVTDLVTVSAPTPDSAKDMGTVTINLGNGSDFSLVSQTDAIEAETVVTSRPLSKGSITVNGNVSQGWYEKGDTATDTDFGGNNVSHINMILLGILRNHNIPTKKHNGSILDMTGGLNFGSVIHDATNDNGSFYAFNGASFNAARLEYNGEIVRHFNNQPTLGFTQTEKTLGEDLNDRGFASPFIIGPSTTEIINHNILTSGIILVTGQLTAAEVKALNTTQIEAIPAGGTDVVNVPVRVMWRMALNSGNFDSGHTIILRNAAVTSFIMSNFLVTGFTAGQIKYEMETTNQIAKGSIEQKNSVWEFFAAADSVGGDSTVEFAIQYFEWIPQ